MTILSVSHLSVGLPPGADRRLAVDDVSFDLQRGETLCLIGGSGSGKSALATAMMAALPTGLVVTSGNVTLNDENLTAMPEAALRRLRGNRIALVPQNPIAALNPLMRVGAQIAEVLEIHENLDAQSRQARVNELIGSVGLGDLADVARRYPHQLSGGQCQRVAIAMALAMRPDVLIADEPTTALDTISQALILQLLGDLRAKFNFGLVFISHDLAIVANIADRIAVIDMGRIVEIGASLDVLERPQHAVTKALLASSRPLANRRKTRSGDAVLEISRLGKAYAGVEVVRDVCFSIEAGTTLAVVGRSGSGKSTLARLVVQLESPDSGTIMIAGTDVFALRGAAQQRARRLAQMVFQDPFGALNPRRRIGDAIARAAELAGADRGTAKARAFELLALVGLPPASYDRLPAAFSGGQCQRIGIARALAMAPRLLICDESISGLDAVVAAEVIALLEAIQHQTGVAILFITHDLRSAGAIADRIAVMDAGQIVEIGDASQVLMAPQSDAARALVSAMPSLSSAGDPQSRPTGTR